MTTLDALSFALDVVFKETPMKKRPRLAKNEFEIECPGCQEEDADPPLMLIVEIDYDQGCEDYAAARSFTATGCEHVEDSDDWRAEIEAAIDEHAREQAEGDEARRYEKEAGE